MIENLEIIGFNNDFINELIETHGYDITLNLAANYLLVKENINLLNNYNFTNIKEIILHNPDIFFINTLDLVKKFKNINLNIFSKLVKEDVTLIDEILKEI